MLTEDIMIWCIFFTFFNIALSTTSAGDVTSHSCNGTRQYEYKPTTNCQCLEFTLEPQIFWNDAESKCEKRGGQLVIIRDEDKQKFISDTLRKISNKNGVWIGMKRDKNEQLRWVDGTLLASGGFTDWGQGEPNQLIDEQGCVLMHRDYNWRWKDYNCNFVIYSYICEYEMSCEVPEPEVGLSTEVVIGIVVGGVVGVICFFAVVFMIINCCRESVRSKRHSVPEVQMRHVETGSNYANDDYTSEPMIPPPEKASMSKYPGVQPTAISRHAENDLDKASVRRKKAPLMTANVVVAAADVAPSHGPTSRGSIKISNLSKPTDSGEKRRNSAGSIEDNYLNLNTDTDDVKGTTADGVNKL